MRKIEIFVNNDGEFCVREGAGTTGTLRFGEMLEQIVSMVYRGTEPKFYLQTPEQLEVHRQKYRAVFDDPFKDI